MPTEHLIDAHVHLNVYHEADRRPTPQNAAVLGPAHSRAQARIPPPLAGDGAAGAAPSP